MTHPDACTCRTCTLWEALRNEGRPSIKLGVPRPTAAQLERHARKFGPEGVEEVADELGLVVRVEHPKAKKAPKGPAIRERVAGHVAAGRSVELIAELENLSPSRARRLVREVGSEAE